MIQGNYKNIHNVKIKRLKIRHETKQNEWCVTQGKIGRKSSASG